MVEMWFETMVEYSNVDSIYVYLDGLGAGIGGTKVAFWTIT